MSTKNNVPEVDITVDEEKQVIREVNPEKPAAKRATSAG